MSVLAAAIVDWKTLGKVALWSLGTGVGLALVFSLAIVGAARFADMRRDGRSIEAGGYAVLLVVSLAAVTAAVVLGIIVMAKKS
jgi:cytosine/adenosine deaminase-related metal-dependent hydrolase